MLYPQCQDFYPQIYVIYPNLANIAINAIYYCQLASTYVVSRHTSRRDSLLTQPCSTSMMNLRNTLSTFYADAGHPADVCLTWQQFAKPTLEIQFAKPDARTLLRLRLDLLAAPLKQANRRRIRRRSISR